MKVLFFDTETNGMALFDKPYSHVMQPRIIQLGAVLCDNERKIRCSLNALIKPNGWTIDPGAQEIHGISLEMCEDTGMPVANVMGMFGWMVNQAEMTVAHNIGFDTLVMQSEHFRAGVVCPVDHRLRYCTMLSSTNICKLPGRRPGQFKWPSLAEAHRILTGADFTDAHDAMADVLACMRIYYQLEDRGVAAVPVPAPRV